MSSGVASKKFIELAGPENAEGILLPAGRLIVEAQLPAGHPQKSSLSQLHQGLRGAIPPAGLDLRRPCLGCGDARLPRPSGRRNSAEPRGIRDALEKDPALLWHRAASSISRPEDHSGLTEEAFAMIRITKGDWEMLR